jgi:hypothetical protein
MKMITRLAVLMVFPVLAGCAGTIVVMEPVSNQLYTVDDFDYASRNGEIKTRVGDDPFGGPSARFSEMVTARMYGANFGGDVVFTRSPRGAGSGRHHVVMLFNPPISADEEDFCAKNAKFPTLPATDSLRLVSAFCYKDTLLSTATGEVSGIRNPQSPLFRELVRQVTMALFPANDDLDIGGDDETAKN